MSSSYWAKRIEEENKRALQRSITETNKALAIVYKEQSTKLYNELLAVLAKIQEDSTDGKLYINDLYRTNKMYTLIRYFNKCSAKIGGEQIKITKKALIDTYKHAQDIVGQNIPQNLVNTSFSVPSAIPTSQIIQQSWCVDGLNFSDRIWKNKAQLTQDLSKTLGDLIMRGKSPYEISKGVAARLDVDQAAAYRIVRTETAHAQVAAQVDKYKEYGFTHGRFKASDPCDDCGKLDGQLFTLDELKQMIPRHPNCECSFLLEV